MNTKGNQRYEETKKKIKGTFLVLLKERKADQITVTEICREAGLHRTTFYGHYEDVPALMKEMVSEMYLQIIGFFSESEWKDGRAGFEKLFCLIQEHHSFFQQYFDSMGGYLGTEEKLPDLLQERIRQIMTEMEYKTEAELRYHQAFFISGLTAVIRRWIAGGCQETPQEMSRMIEREYAPNRNLF